MTPFPRFVSLNPSIPDLSIPELYARIQKESDISLRGIAV